MTRCCAARTDQGIGTQSRSMHVGKRGVNAGSAVAGLQHACTVVLGLSLGACMSLKRVYLQGQQQQVWSAWRDWGA